jgi:predicted Zn-dependent protease
MMLDAIIEILQKEGSISDWRITRRETEAAERFFIRKRIEVKRAKRIEDFSLTVYVDGKGGTRGESTVRIHPTMVREEILACVRKAAFAASQIENPFYPCPSPKKPSLDLPPSGFSGKDLEGWMDLLQEALFKPDVHGAGGINSLELFLNEIRRRTVSSRGIDFSRGGFLAAVECVADWREGGREAVEAFSELSFSEPSLELLSRFVSEEIGYARDRAQAEPTPDLRGLPVLLTAEAARSFFQYYVNALEASRIHRKISPAKIGESLMGEDAAGDRITIKTDPLLGNSPAISALDEDGVPLDRIILAEDGIARNIHGSFQFCHYLGKSPAGRHQNFIVECGKASESELRDEPYLEPALFSDFFVDSDSGDFGGEIRLAYWFDGKRRRPITGGSISGSVSACQADMRLSSTQCLLETMAFPKTLKLTRVGITPAS